jgi:hypothetical protein
VLPGSRSILAWHITATPPDEWKDVDSVVGPEGARFASDLRAWVEVDNGRIGPGVTLATWLVRLFLASASPGDPNAATQWSGGY